MGQIEIIDAINSLFFESKNLEALEIIDKNLSTINSRSLQLYLMVLKSKILRYTLYSNLERFSIVDDKLLEEIRLLHDLDLESQAIIEYVYNFWSLGQIEEANVILDHESQIFSNITNLETQAAFYNLKGIISSAKGDLNSGIENSLKCLTIRKKLSNDYLTAQILNNLALNYGYKREINLAEQYCLECLEILRTLNNPFTLANALDTYLEILFFSNNESLITPIISELESLSLSNPNSLDIEVIYKLNKALSLKIKSRLIYKTKAGEILSQIIYDKKYDHLYLYIQKQRAIKHYCEILLLELQVLDNMEILQEINEVVKMLEKMAKIQNSAQVLIETLILKSKLALLQGDVSDVERILQTALDLSIKNRIDQLTVDIETEMKNFEKEFSKWNNLVNSNASMHEKMEKSKILDYIKQVQEKIL